MKEKKRREEKTRREKKGGEIKEMRKKEASQGIKPRTFCTAVKAQKICMWSKL